MLKDELFNLYNSLNDYQEEKQLFKKELRNAIKEDDIRKFIETWKAKVEILQAEDLLKEIENSKVEENKDDITFTIEFEPNGEEISEWFNRQKSDKKKTYDRELGKANSEYLEKIKGIKEELAGELSKLKEYYKVAIAMIEDRFEVKLDNIDTEFSKKMENIREKFYKRD